MSTVNFSVPEQVKQVFNDVFMGQNKSAIIARLMQEAVEREQRKKTGAGSLSEHTGAQKESTRHYRRTVTHRT